MMWYTLFSFPLLVTVAWLYTINIAKGRFPRLRNKRICLLIAHPDDEAMFFGPTLLALTVPALGNHVKILCLSSGNADGLGETRKKELAKSAIQLGLRKEEDVFIVESPDYPDSMTTKWDADKISALLSSAFAPELTKPFNSTSAPTATIDVLLTFDAHGVSSHLNHISLFHGARQFIASLRANRPGWACPVDLYTLTSISVFRKYLGFGDSLVSIAAMALSKRGAAKDKEQRLLFLSDIGEVRTAQGAMTGAHISQMRWFRYGWIWASRYMYLNDLKLEKV